MLLGRFFAAFALAALTHRFQLLFTTLGAGGSTLDEFGAHQLEHRLLRSVALPPAETHDTGVAAVALAEARSELLEQLLHRIRSIEKRSRLAARMQVVLLGETDHFVHQRLRGFRLGNRGDNALFQNHARDQAAQQGVARTHIPPEFISGVDMSHSAISPTSSSSSSGS